MTKPTLLVSFSGGRTSAYMARWLQISLSQDFNIVFVFMNTSAEDDLTLDFVNECNKRWALNLVWLEAIFNPEKGKGTTYRITDYKNAKRDGSVFLDMCRKYGVPNAGFAHCNRELKLHPFEKYRAENYPGSVRAIGIRVDEFDRMVVDADKNGIVYPLIKWHPTTKGDVLRWWQKQDFNLMIPEHRGNCLTCWKKSDRKLYTLYGQMPWVFDLFDKIENDPLVIAATQPKNSGVFYRDYRSTADIIREAKKDFEEFKDPYFSHIEDLANGCSDHCEPFTGETQSDFIGYGGIVESIEETLAAIDEATSTVRKARKRKRPSETITTDSQVDMFDC